MERARSMLHRVGRTSAEMLPRSFAGAFRFEPRLSLCLRLDLVLSSGQGSGVCPALVFGFNRNRFPTLVVLEGKAPLTQRHVHSSQPTDANPKKATGGSSLSLLAALAREFSTGQFPSHVTHNLDPPRGKRTMNSCAFASQTIPSLSQPASGLAKPGSRVLCV